VTQLMSSVGLITFFAYLAAAIIFMAVFWFNSFKLRRTSLYAFYLALALHTFLLVQRTISSGQLPFSSLYEFILVFAWGCAVLYLYASSRLSFYHLGMVVLPLEVFLLGYGFTMDSSLRPVVPALQSMWLQLHVGTAILAYGLFALSFAAALLYLYQGKLETPYLPQDKTAKMIYNFIAAGFPFMTLVLITGAVWAEEVWGSWWSWDPKETWALITWLIYVIYLHLYKTQQWRQQVSAWLSVVGFAAVIFTLFGVTLLMPGVHSY